MEAVVRFAAGGIPFVTELIAFRTLTASTSDGKASAKKKALIFTIHLV